MFFLVFSLRERLSSQSQLLLLHTQSLLCVIRGSCLHARAGFILCVCLKSQVTVCTLKRFCMHLLLSLAFAFTQTFLFVCTFCDARVFFYAFSHTLSRLRPSLKHCSTRAVARHFSHTLCVCALVTVLSVSFTGQLVRVRVSYCLLKFIWTCLDTFSEVSGTAFMLRDPALWPSLYRSLDPFASYLSVPKPLSRGVCSALHAKYIACVNTAHVHTHTVRAWHVLVLCLLFIHNVVCEYVSSLRACLVFCLCEACVLTVAVWLVYSQSRVFRSFAHTILTRYVLCDCWKLNHSFSLLFLARSLSRVTERDSLVHQST